MSLSELIVVMAISSIVMALVFSVTATFAKTDSRNMIRQNRVDAVRQVSLWLGEALTYAQSPYAESGADTGVAIFQTAQPQEMKFTSALAVSNAVEKGALSQVRVVLGQDCAGGAAPGVLYRCVTHARLDSGGAQYFCAWKHSSCDANLFKETVMARGVKNQQLFTYFLEGAATGAESVGATSLGDIRAVEMRVTVKGNEKGQVTESTVFKRYAVNEWRRL
jgi:hypothetical protein